MRACAQVLGLFLALGVLPAHAQQDWFASVYTPGGIEVRADARVFALFALFNRTGYDTGTLRREHPVPAWQYPPSRARVRQGLSGAEPSVLQRAQAFFDAHPLPLEHYLAATVFMEDEDAPAEPRELAGLEVLLDRVEEHWPVPALRAETFPDYRAAMRAYLPLLDEPWRRTHRLLHLPEGKPLLRLVVNLLDAEGQVHGFRTRQGAVVVVVGPSRTPALEKVMWEYARALLPTRIGEQAQARWAVGPTLLREAQARGARETTVGAYAVALLSRALALSALAAPPSAYEDAGREGYFGLQELAGSFDNPRPVDAWALEGLARIGSERPSRK
ncbi:uncharacterized protein STAUR_4326 [Stigmatella aurantiaca DW4/3-1]|uniref:Uncharacterized protein n=2 Tax=Stigmatella aurantiaca TaxID=41 RepID=Q08Q03_STIAD|nr:uncharacterized protein STAUR_4326 [Stigmatella aurantiaca DW4/3-1]EAU62563.1 hypothetical protein STIAU_6542 [Stigmatella aurantiaca DW4/3-1]